MFSSVSIRIATGNRWCTPKGIWREFYEETNYGGVGRIQKLSKGCLTIQGLAIAKLSPSRSEGTGKKLWEGIQPCQTVVTKRRHTDPELSPPLEQIQLERGQRRTDPGKGGSVEVSLQGWRECQRVQRRSEIGSEGKPAHPPDPSLVLLLTPDATLLSSVESFQG